MSAKYIYINFYKKIQKKWQYITKLHNIILYLKMLNLQNLHIYIDYVEKIISAFLQVVYDLFKLKHVYILTISSIIILRP